MHAMINDYTLPSSRILARNNVKSAQDVSNPSTTNTSPNNSIKLTAPAKRAKCTAFVPLNIPLDFDHFAKQTFAHTVAGATKKRQPKVPTTMKQLTKSDIKTIIDLSFLPSVVASNSAQVEKTLSWSDILSNITQPHILRDNLPLIGDYKVLTSNAHPTEIDISKAVATLQTINSFSKQTYLWLPHNLLFNAELCSQIDEIIFLTTVSSNNFTALQYLIKVINGRQNAPNIKVKVYKSRKLQNTEKRQAYVKATGAFKRTFGAKLVTKDVNWW